jgi:hypothetical protein
MRVLVDADACPVKDIIEKTAQEWNLEVIMFCNPNHSIESSYARVIMVDFAPEAVDLAIINRTRAGDIVVTQDYGLASLVLAKRAQAIHPDGKIYDPGNINALLTQRYLNARARRAGVRISGPSKRSPAQDQCFTKNFIKLLQNTSDMKGD